MTIFQYSGFNSMQRMPFKGIYLQITGDPFCFSFVTYTPQTRAQMISCGDLKDSEEYFNPIIFDFLLFLSERVLKQSPNETLQINYDDLEIICHRERGGGIQSEYLLRINPVNWDQTKQNILNSAINILSQNTWNGSFLT